jgi:hypothetical protein
MLPYNNSQQQFSRTPRRPHSDLQRNGRHGNPARAVASGLIHPTALTPPPLHRQHSVTNEKENMTTLQSLHPLGLPLRLSWDQNKAQGLDRKFPVSELHSPDRVPFSSVTGSMANEQHPRSTQPPSENGPETKTCAIKTNSELSALANPFRPNLRQTVNNNSPPAAPTADYNGIQGGHGSANQGYAIHSFGGSQKGTEYSSTPIGHALLVWLHGGPPAAPGTLLECKNKMKMLYESSRYGSSTADQAEELLKNMLNHRMYPDGACYNWAVSACAGKPEVADRILRMMWEHWFIDAPEYGGSSAAVQPNARIYNSVILTWGRSKDPEAPDRSKDLLEAMEFLADTGNFPDCSPDRVTYNSVMWNWSRSGRDDCVEQVERFLRRMMKRARGGSDNAQDKYKHDELIPDHATYSALLVACRFCPDPFETVDRATAIVQEMVSEYTTGQNRFLVSGQKLPRTNSHLKIPGSVISTSVFCRTLLRSAPKNWLSGWNSSTHPTKLKFLFFLACTRSLSRFGKYPLIDVPGRDFRRLTLLRFARRRTSSNRQDAAEHITKLEQKCKGSRTSRHTKPSQSRMLSRRVTQRHIT